MTTNRTVLLTATALAGAAAAGLLLVPRVRRAADADWLRARLDRAQAGLTAAEAQVAAAGAQFQARLAASGTPVDWSIDSEEVARDLPRMPHA